MASPDLVLFKIYRHLTSSASPTISLQPAHSVTHLPDTLRAFPLSVSGGAPAGHPPEPAHAATLCLTPSCRRTLVSAVSGALPSSLLVWCLCSPRPLSDRCLLPQTAVSTWKHRPRSWVFIPLPRSLVLAQFAPLETYPHWAGIEVPGRKVGGEEV